MFSIDDRAGNVVTTVALFLVAASVPTVAVLRIVWLGCFSTRSSSTALSDRPPMQVKA
jgi:hypothetical protein